MLIPEAAQVLGLSIAELLTELSISKADLLCLAKGWNTTPVPIEKVKKDCNGRYILDSAYEQSEITTNDFIYFDPPYTVAHATNGFVKYNERIFSWQDQERLASHASDLASRGCRVIVSNADHPSLHKLYKDFECHVVERPSVIAASSKYRRQITECIFVLGDLRGSQGQTTRTRRCQQAIRSKFSHFNPAGLDDFINSEKEQTNLKAKLIIDRLEVMLKRVVIEELKQEFSTDENAWWQEGVPKPVRLEVAKRQESDDNQRGMREAYFDLIEYRTIATSNWPLFQKLLGFGKKNDSKDKQTKWLVEINEWRNQVAHASSGVILRVDDLTQLENYAEWFKGKVTTQNDGFEESSTEFSDAVEAE